jgi:hypothetical protein
MIRDEQYKNYLQYLKTHNGLIFKGQHEFVNSIQILRRFLRVWRRLMKLQCLTPEILDYVIIYYVEESVASSVFFYIKNR